MFDTDLIGWELDDALEGFEVDFAIENGMAIDSTGEPGDPFLDAHVRDEMEGPFVATFAGGARCKRPASQHDCDCPACEAWSAALVDTLGWL